MMTSRSVLIPLYLRTAFWATILQFQPCQPQVAPLETAAPSFGCRTIPIHVGYLKGSYGTVALDTTMAVIMLSITPIIILYLFCQKHIIKDVAAGAVKG